MHESIKVTQTEHNGWKEWSLIPDDKKKLFQMHPRGYFGRWIYKYKSEKGEVKMFQLLSYKSINRDVWEIDSELFPSNRIQFETREEAENHIENVLKVRNKSMVRKLTNQKRKKR
jgi:hypothetical protein